MNKSSLLIRDIKIIGHYVENGQCDLDMKRFRESKRYGGLDRQRKKGRN